MPSFIEISHPILPGMKTYPGLPVPVVDVFLDYDASHDVYAEGTEFFIASLHLCGNTGTYVDSPRHRFRDGADLSQLPLERLAHLPISVIDVRDSSERGITHTVVRGRHLAGRAVLFHTAWSNRWGTEEYFEPNPFLTADCCRALLDAGAIFVGIDSLNIDDIHDPRRPAHTQLLGAGVPVCEHLTGLEALPDADGYLHAVPVAWRGGATFPVRAYVVL